MPGDYRAGPRGTRYCTKSMTLVLDPAPRRARMFMQAATTPDAREIELKDDGLSNCEAAGSRLKTMIYVGASALAALLLAGLVPG